MVPSGAYVLRVSKSYCARLVRAGGDAWITRDLTDDELAHGDLATIARDFYQRYRAVLSG